MNRIVALSLVAALGTFPINVNAEAPKSILGIVLDSPFQIPRCETFEKGTDPKYYPVTDICWHPMLSMGFDAAEQGEFSPVTILMKLVARPDYVSGDLSGILMRGSVVQLNVPTNGDLSWHELEKLLTNKFGKPSEVVYRPPGEHSSHYSKRKLADGIEIEHRAFGRKQFEHRGTVTATSKNLRDYYEQARLEKKKGQLEF